MDRPRFVFVALGTHGDVLPPLAIAAEMVARGHECRLLANARFAEHAAARGVGFTAMAAPDLSTPPGAEFGEAATDAAHAATVEFFRQGSGKRRTVVINLSESCSSNLICEAERSPAVRLRLAPFHIRSLTAPPWPSRSEMEGPLAHTYSTYTLPHLYRQLDEDVDRLRVINRRRRSLGLGAVESCLPRSGEPWVIQQFALFPDWFCAPAPDWPSGIELAGFPLPPTLPGPEISAPWVDWLSRHERPLVFTPGTSPGVHVDHFFEQAIRCCQLLKRPGVLLSPKAPRSAEPLPSDILHLAYVDLGALLPRCELLVHHGGVGTTARALQAGVPQIISPLVYDQFDNAERVQRLGVGLKFDRRKFFGARLASNALELLTDRGTRERVQRLQRRVAEDRCVARCADFLESSAAATVS